jgi:prepilin-type N-terminal cleavage/methylation domain-containing protein
MRINNNNNKGFTLIELMVVVAIIGVLAIIALPIYNHYIEKTKLHSALPAIGTYKNDVAICFMKNDETEDCNDGREGIHPADVQINHILDIDVISGNILLTLDAENHFSDIYPVKLLFSPRNPDPAAAVINWNVYCNDYDETGGTHLYHECSGILNDDEYDGDGEIDLGDNGAAILNIELISNNAGYDSSFGYYYTDQGGIPLSGTLLFTNAKNQVNEQRTFLISTNNSENIGFFLIPNGGSLNNYSNGDMLSFSTSGNGYLDSFFEGSLVETSGNANVIFSEFDLNYGGIDSEINNNFLGNSNWEDIINGDNDYNDVNLRIKLL